MDLRLVAVGFLRDKKKERGMKRQRQKSAPLAAAGTLLFVVAFGSGCSNAGEGALSGAALGALAGMGLGSLTGSMGQGAAAGAIIGGVGGAVIGDQNSRQERYR